MIGRWEFLKGILGVPLVKATPVLSPEDREEFWRFTWKFPEGMESQTSWRRVQDWNALEKNRSPNEIIKRTITGMGLYRSIRGKWRKAIGGSYEIAFLSGRLPE